jgi:predicted RND superfamily exporter protein
MNKLVRFTFRYPPACIVFWASLALLSCSFLRHLEIDNNFSRWFNQSNKAFREYIQRNRLFGNDRYLVIAYRNERLFSNQGISETKRILESLKSLDGVEAAAGLTSVPVILSDGTFLAPLGSNERVSDSVLASVGRTMSRSEYYGHFIVSGDGRKTALLIEPSVHSPRAYIRLVHSVELTLREKFPEIKFYLSGGVYIDAAYNELSAHESVLFGTACGILIFIACLLYFRTFAGALVPLCCAGVASIITGGLYSAAGIAATAVTIIMPLVVMIVATATSMHIVHALSRIGPFGEQWRQSIRELLYPSFLTSLTTAIGFLSFCITSIVPLRNLGLFTAAGLMIAYMVCYTLGPAIMRLIPPRAGRTFNLKQNLIVPFSIRRRWYLVGVSVAVLAVMAVGMARLRFETDQIRQLRADHPVRCAIDTLESWFQGVYPIDMVIESPDGRALGMGELRPLLEPFELRLRGDRRIVKILSPLTVDRFAQTPAALFAPWIADSVFAMATAGKGKGLSAVFSQHHTACRIHIWTHWLTNVRTQALADWLKRMAAECGITPRFSVSVSGLSLMFVELDRLLVQDQLSSFGLCFVLVFLVFLCRHVRPGFRRLP